MILLGLSAIFAGLLMGTLGAGGGIIMVPVMIYVLKLSHSVAVQHSLLIMMFTSAITFGMESQKLNFHFKWITLLALGGMGGSLVGVLYFSNLLAPSTRMIFFISFLLVAGMVVKKKPQAPTTTEGGKGKIQLKLGLAGFGVGLTSSLLGVGGGLMTTPLLYRMTSLTLSEAAAHSIFLVFINALVASAGYVFTSSYELQIILTFTLLTLPAAYLGRRIRQYCAPSSLERAFQAVVWSLALGLFLDHFVF